MNISWLPWLMLALGIVLIGYALWRLYAVISFKQKGAVLEEFTVADDDMKDLKQPLTHLIRNANPEQEFMIDLGSKTVKPRDTVKLWYLEGNQPLWAQVGQQLTSILTGAALIFLAVAEMIGMIRVL